MSELDETTRRKYLEEMGMTVWSSRAPADGDESAGKTVSGESRHTVIVSASTGFEPGVVKERLPEPLPAEALADEFSSVPAEVEPQADTNSPVTSPVPVSPGEDTWDGLLNEINHCERCHLCKTRNRVVPGVGDRNAGWLFVGEGPGFHEDQQGEPFVGRSGHLLDSMMAAMHMKRGDNVYIANVVK